MRCTSHRLVGCCRAANRSSKIEKNRTILVFSYFRKIFSRDPKWWEMSCRSRLGVEDCRCSNNKSLLVFRYPSGNQQEPLLKRVVLPPARDRQKRKNWAQRVRCTWSRGRRERNCSPLCCLWSCEWVLFASLWGLWTHHEASWQFLCGGNLSKDILVSDQVWLGVSVSLWSLADRCRSLRTPHRTPVPSVHPTAPPECLVHLQAK